MSLRPNYGWRPYLRRVPHLYAYFRGAEYPAGRIEAAIEAVRFGWGWPE